MIYYSGVVSQRIQRMSLKFDFTVKHSCCHAYHAPMLSITLPWNTHSHMVCHSLFPERSWWHFSLCVVQVHVTTVGRVAFGCFARLFCECAPTMSESLRSWRLSPPHTAAYPDIAPLLHPLWSVTKEAGATVVSPAPTFQTLPREPHFPTIWESERANRRDLFAPKWNFKRRLMTTNIPWEKVYASWDRVNANIHLSTKKHVQKLAALRMTTASTKTSGTWIYAVWSLRDDKVYIGQTGARTHRRSVGKRGSEHVRLALDALRLSGTGINLPSQVYSWISRLGVENFVVTPLEHTTPHQANAREKWWMLRWGLAGLFNRDLPSLSNKKWLFLSLAAVNGAEHPAAEKTTLATRLLAIPTALSGQLHQPVPAPITAPIPVR